MKKIAALSLFLGFIFAGINAQDAQQVKADSIIFEKLVHDYGTIKQGSDGSCSFKYTNKGKVPLILTNVRASCGCTVPEWSKEPLAPGQEAFIKVKYNTRITGNFNKAITVTSNATNSQVILRVKGNVIPTS